MLARVVESDGTTNDFEVALGFLGYRDEVSSFSPRSALIMARLLFCQAYPAGSRWLASYLANSTVLRIAGEHVGGYL